MSSFCAHQKQFLGTYFEPPEIWCELNCDEMCGEDCPHRRSREDCGDDYADYESILDII